MLMLLLHPPGWNQSHHRGGGDGTAWLAEGNIVPTHRFICRINDSSRRKLMRQRELEVWQGTGPDLTSTLHNPSRSLDV